MPEYHIFKKEIVDTNDIEETLEIGNSSIYRHRKSGVIPPPDFYIGHSPRWFGERLNRHFLNQKRPKIS